MNEKIYGWLAAGIIAFMTGWIYELEPFSTKQLQIVVAAVLVFGLIIHIIALRKSKRTVIKRRRMFKEIWRRFDRGDTDLDYPEEESIKLLGRIKGRKYVSAFGIAGTLLALYFGMNLLSLVLALGNFFLAGKLLLIAHNIDRTLFSDSERELPGTVTSQSNADRYVVDIDIVAVHDFIAPRNALPFWTVADAANWLAECGFRRKGDGRWECQKNMLKYLDSDEIRVVEPMPGD